MKFKNRLNKIVSLILSTLMVLILIPSITIYTANYFGLGSGSNGVVMSGSWLPMVNATDVSVDNNLQAIRISLIKYGSESNPDGMPYIDDKIIQNPIQIYNENNYFMKNAKKDKTLRFIVNEDDKSLTASRREILSWDRSNTNLTKAPMVYGCHFDSNSNTWVADAGDNFIKTASLRDYVYDDPGVPDFLSGSISSYQEESRAKSLGHPEWATMSNAEYFTSYVKSAIYVPEAGKMVPDFAYRTIAKMIGRFDNPYCEEVEQFYNDHILSNECTLLIEPMMFLHNTPNSYTEEVFGPASETPFIGMTCGEIGFLDDSYSGVNYGYTDLGNHNRQSSSDGNPNNYNYLTSPDSSAAKACVILFKSCTLESNEPELGLYSPLGAISPGGLRDQTMNYIKDGDITDETRKGLNFGPLLGDGTTNKEHLGAAFNGPVYNQVYKDANNKNGKLSNPPRSVNNTYKSDLNINDEYVSNLSETYQNDFDTSKDKFINELYKAFEDYGATDSFTIGKDDIKR